MFPRPSARYRNLPEPCWMCWERSSKAILDELKRSGKKTYAITDSDPPFYGHANRSLSERLVETIKEGWDMYPSNSPWRDELSNAISEFEKKYRNVDYSPDDIVLTPGVGGAWCIIHYSFLEALDDVVVIEPAHYMWTPISYLPIFGTRVLSSPCDENKEWEPRVEHLREQITTKTKFIVVDHPNNPTGAVYSEKALKGIVNVAGEHDIPVISDEMYGLICFDGARAKSVAEVAGDVPVIVLHGMSKIFMRTGWRVGYIALHDPQNRIVELRNVLRKFSLLYGHATTGIPTPILAAAAKSFRGCMKESWNFVREIQLRRDFTFKRLNEIEGISCSKPKAALYAFPRLHSTKAWRTDEEFMLHLAREEGVVFVPGSFFGESGRWHFRTLMLPEMETLEEVYSRLERFLKHTT